MKTVLVVDDSETMRIQVASALEQAGMRVVEARDGSEGLLKAAQESVSVVLADVNMRGMGGLEMLEALRAEPRTREIPVLMLTTEVQPQLIERARRAHAAGWIFKPADLELVVATVKKIADESLPP